jgi:type II secretory pathway pseudopilin PulG
MRNNVEVGFIRPVKVYPLKRFGLRFRFLTGQALVELIITILLVGIFSLVAAQIVVSTIQSLVFASNKARTDFVAADILDSMIEGMAMAKGLRFSLNITAIPDNNQITFNNQDNQSINYTLSVNKITWSINGVSQGYLPYYANLPSDINIRGKNDRLFTWYDANNIEIIDPLQFDNVRRVEINLIVRTGSGSFSGWQGYSEQSSCVAVKKFQ